MAQKEYVKTIVEENVNPTTGEISFVKKRTETIGSSVSQYFLLLRCTDDLKIIRGLKGYKFHIMAILAYNGNSRDNTVNTSGAMIDEMGAFLELTPRRIRDLINELEKDCYLIKMWGGKYMLNPDVFVLGGNKRYLDNVRKFKKAMGVKSAELATKAKSSIRSWEEEHE